MTPEQEFCVRDDPRFTSVLPAWLRPEATCAVSGVINGHGVEVLDVNLIDHVLKGALVMTHGHVEEQ
jgi:hypothetical protein